MDAFWHLGFVTVKPLEVLLSRDDVTLFDVLDDRTLFDECKDKNPKIIEYLSSTKILRQLLGFALGDFADPTVNKPKFQHIATEVLCSEIDAFTEVCLDNNGELLTGFWKRGMQSPRGEGTSVLMLHFCKVFVAFLTRKPHDVFTFIQRQPGALDDVLVNLDMPQVADLLLKVLLLDREPTNEPVVDWFCEQMLMKRLLEKISPQSDVGAHQSTLELIKNIILMSSFTPTPGRKEASVLSSNRLSRDLVSPSNSTLLISHLFPVRECDTSPVATTPTSDSSIDSSAEKSSISSFMNTAATVMELIRKNNSDYFEQYLFLRAREHLMAVQESMQQDCKEGETADCKPVLEKAMDEIMSKCGLVNLGTLISAICDKLHLLQDRLRRPLSPSTPIPSTVGLTVPLTFERLRICELYGELLHYSNMLLPNRPVGSSPSYDEEGRLIGGLDALGDLGEAMMAEADPDIEEEEEEEECVQEQAFPVSQQNRRRRSFASDTDSDRGSAFNEEVRPDVVSEPESGSSNEATTRITGPSPASSIENIVDRLSLVVPASPSGKRQQLPAFATCPPSITGISKPSSIVAPTAEPEAVTEDNFSDVGGDVEQLSPGDRLKTRFMELGILTTLVDLVFQFPWNNFLHSVVYDILHQVLFGKVEGTLNRALIISIFHNVKLPQRIVDAQQKNDSQAASEPRLGYMGHLTLMAVDIISALEKYPDDLLAVLEPLLPQPAWDEYVIGAHAETQRMENIVLGGPRPQSYARDGPRSQNGWGGDWNDEEDFVPSNQEFRRGNFSSRQTADFGPAPEEEEDATFHFNPSHGFGVAGGWGSGSSSDSEDEHEAWIKNSDSANPRHSRDPEQTGFDDSFAFEASRGTGGPRELTQEEEDEAFGAFTNADGDTARFDTDFGHEDFDFGEFQSGESDEPPPDGTNARAHTGQ